MLAAWGAWAVGAQMGCFSLIYSPPPPQRVAKGKVLVAVTLVIGSDGPIRPQYFLSPPPLQFVL